MKQPVSWWRSMSHIWGHHLGSLRCLGCQGFNSCSFKQTTSKMLSRLHIYIPLVVFPEVSSPSGNSKTVSHDGTTLVTPSKSFNLQPYWDCRAPDWWKNLQAEVSSNWSGVCCDAHGTIFLHFSSWGSWNEMKQICHIRITRTVFSVSFSHEFKMIF